MRRKWYYQMPSKVFCSRMFRLQIEKMYKRQKVIWLPKIWTEDDINTSILYLCHTHEFYICKTQYVPKTFQVLTHYSRRCTFQINLIDGSGSVTTFIFGEIVEKHFPWQHNIYLTVLLVSRLGLIYMYKYNSNWLFLFGIDHVVLFIFYNRLPFLIFYWLRYA